MFNKRRLHGKQRYKQAIGVAECEFIFSQSLNLIPNTG